MAKKKEQKLKDLVDQFNNEMLGPLKVNQTDEIFALSSKKDSYVWNLNTLRAGDLNFDQMNKNYGRNRYVV